MVANYLEHAGPMGISGLCLVLVVGIGLLLAPVLAPYGPLDQHLNATFAPPGTPGFILGTDELGRDVWTRLLYGGRTSIAIAFGAIAIAAVVGGLGGMLAGFFGSWFDIAAMRIVDVFASIPTIMLALGVIGILGPGPVPTIFALGFAYSAPFARIWRSATVAMRSQTYVEAAQLLGASPTRIIREDVVRMIQPTVVVHATGIMAFALLDEAALGFLGLGVQPPDSSWGSMLATGRTLFANSPTVALFAGLSVMIAVFGINLLGDGIRATLDPRGRKA
jgi:peptide/nickel transport system permease protein